jgi:hypothetical protein
VRADGPRANLLRAAPTEIRSASGAARIRPSAGTSPAATPDSPYNRTGPIWSRDHVAGKGLDGMMLGLVACR